MAGRLCCASAAGRQAVAKAVVEARLEAARQSQESTVASAIEDRQAKARTLYEQAKKMDMPWWKTRTAAQLGAMRAVEEKRYRCVPGRVGTSARANPRLATVHGLAIFRCHRTAYGGEGSGGCKQFAAVVKGVRRPMLAACRPAQLALIVVVADACVPQRLRRRERHGRGGRRCAKQAEEQAHRLPRPALGRRRDHRGGREPCRRVQRCGGPAPSDLTNQEGKQGIEGTRIA